MHLETQFRIKSDSNYSRYLRENSRWYKILNRSPERFNEFVNEMKERYKLRTSDKIGDLSNKLDLVRSVLSVLQ